jgi:hypothetical protein
MALDKSLPGPKAVAYYHQPWFQLTWKRVDPNMNYWVVSYRGKHVGEYFQGKTGAWCGIIFSRGTIWRYDGTLVMQVMTGTIVGPKQ